MKIGIVSTSRIIDVFWVGLQDMKNIEVTAICCRPQSEAKAQMWAEKYNIPAVYTDYDKFLAEGDFDFVYDGTVNSMHYSDAKKCVLAGRNLILEKPFTVTAEETAELISLAKEKNVWLFEAITTMHSPCFQFMKENLPKLGALRGGCMSFSMMPPRYTSYLKGEMNTTFDPKMAGGCLMDMNMYNLHLAVGLLGMPQDAVYYPNRGWNGIDTSGLAVLIYPEYTVACYAAKDSAGPCGMFLQGDKGHMELLTPPNECAEMVCTVEGKEIRYKNQPIHRFAIEFESINAIWEAQDRKRMEELWEQTQNIMDLMWPMYQKVLEKCDI